MGLQLLSMPTAHAQSSSLQAATECIGPVFSSDSLQDESAATAGDVRTEFRLQSCKLYGIPDSKCKRRIQATV